MSWRLTCIPAACLAAIVGFATSTSAQNRFQIVSQDEAGGLRITVFRDSQLSSCFTVFSMESPAPPPVPEVVLPPSPGELARQDAILRMGEAAVRRNQQLADLNANFERRAGIPYSAWTSNTTYAVDPVLLGNYQQDLQRINQEYENVMLSIVPGTFPYAAPVPGMRTGGLEDAASAMRLALLDPNPTETMRTINGQFARIDDALRRLSAAPRLAASGPFPCAEAPKRTEPPKRR
jgi:hypothetical protein